MLRCFWTRQWIGWSAMGAAGYGDPILTIRVAAHL
jgi:hypothetical protein